jgi:glycosyltransferase involved in cell wall biosynthesis
MSPVRRPRRPVCMLTHSYYEEDPRVRREAEALVAAGRPVDVFALRRPGDPLEGLLEGVRVRRLDVQRHQGAGVGRYLLEYLDFLARAMFAATIAHRRRRYAVVQVHTLPDFLVFAALPMRLAGVPVILDLHEAMPEFFRVRFPRLAGAPAYQLLRMQERLSIAAADAILTVNDALGHRLVDLGVPSGKVTIVPNSPSLRRFDPAAHPTRDFAADGVVTLAYAGALTPTYELEVAIDALASLSRRRPDLAARLDCYGRGDAEPALRERAAALGVADRVVFHGRIPIDDVPAAIARADIGLAPTRRNEFTDYSLSTKIFEYAAMNKPVIASGLPMVEATFDPGTVVTYPPGDAEAMASAILGLVDDAAGREARVSATGRRVADLAWERVSRGYLGLVERLARDGLSSVENLEETR